MSSLPSDLETSHKEIIRLTRELEYLKEQLRLTRAKIFGKSSEKHSPAPSAQVLLFPKPALTEPAPEPKTEKIEYTRTKHTRVEGKLPEGTRFPEHLPREDEIVEEGEGEVVFEKISERLAAKPSAFFVKRIIRRVRRTDGSLSCPAVPPAVIERTTVDVSFLVYLLIAKYMWHLPLYRQEQMLKAQGITISRDTLIRYVISAAGLLKPIYVALGVELFSGDHLFGDETPALVGKGSRDNKRYSESWFWTFLGESGCAFYYAPTRAFKEVEPLMKSFSGDLQCDGYRVYEMLSRKYPEITLVGCWAHARRKFVDAEKGGNAPESTEALRYIRALYKVEARIRDSELGLPETLRLRQRFSKKILKLFERWLKNKASDPAMLPKSLFGNAVSYALKRWEALNRYTDDPKLSIDSNAVERQIRSFALGKKNWLLCASEVGAEASAIIYSLIASCKLADVDPSEYLTDVLERISDHPDSKVTELIPVNWKVLVQAEKDAAAALPQVA